MALRSFGLLLLQTVAAVPTLIARDGINGTACPTANGTIITMGEKSWKVECGIDTYQGDMAAPNGRHAATFDDCIKTCVDRAGCQAVAWFNKDACYLKGKIPRRVVKSSVWGAVIANTNSSVANTNSRVTSTSTVTNTATVTAVGSISQAAASSAAPSVVQAAVDNRRSSAAVPAASYAAPAPAASSKAAPSSVPSSTPNTGSGSCASRPAAKSLSTKRGVSYNSAALTAPFSGKISWVYNWEQVAKGTLPSGTMFVPMLWSPKTPGSWATNAQTAITNGADTLLYANEPDHAEQANLDVATAVAGWKQYMEPFACKARLGAPAVTNGGAPMGLAWLKSFMSACSDCTIDVVPFHWYDSATNIDYFKSYVQSVYTAGGNRPLWLTEFGAAGSDAQIAAFMKAVIPWLDSQPYVERYAYFMASAGNLVTSGSSLSAIGQAYVSA